MIVKIKRQENSTSESYWQEFDYEPKPSDTVTSMIYALNYGDDLLDAEGIPADLIHIETSCGQGVCGACAILINGKPKLACKTFLKDYKDGDITLEPLSKFPVKCDLMVDRSIIWKQSKKAGMYFGKVSTKKVDEEEASLRYQTAKCVKCGICLEICPKYRKSKTFFGAAFANDAFLTTSLTDESKDGIYEQYSKHFYNDCLKCGQCLRNCPEGINTLAAFLYMNKAVIEHENNK